MLNPYCLGYTCFALYGMNTLSQLVYVKPLLLRLYMIKSQFSYANNELSRNFINNSQVGNKK